LNFKQKKPKNGLLEQHMKFKHWAVVAIFASPLAVNAFETRINGFISVGGGMTLSEDQEYVTDPANAGRYTNELSIKPDTMMAIQTVSQVTDRLSATAQLAGYAGSTQFVKYYNEDSNTTLDIEVDRGFDVNFEWAYVNYELTDVIDIKAGRIRMPLFFYSNSLDLGYSYNWVRPPIEVYNVFATSLEGGSIEYDISFANMYGTVTAFYGETDGVDPETRSIVNLSSILGGVLSFELGDLTLRGSYSTDGDANIVRTAYNPFEGSVTTESKALPLSFTSGSLVFDNGTLMVGSEMAATTFQDNTNNDEVSWYVTGGFRWGSLTPHVTYSSFKQKPTASNTSLVFKPGYAGIKLSEYPQEMSAITAGLRWDFDIASALKFEYTSRTDKTVEPSIFEGVWSPFGNAQVVSMSVDVVF
jgi:hypothetical protein